MQKSFIISLITVLFFVSTPLKAQDAHFSQFYANPLYLNPAMAGTNVCPRICINFRDQWPASGEYMTYSVSYDQHFDKLSGGLGIIAFGDRTGGGIFTTYAASLMYSFKLKVTKNFNMRFALSGGYYQLTLDWNRLTFPDMIDPKYGFVYSTQEVKPGELYKGSFDICAGFLAYWQKFYFGFAVSHLNPMHVGFIVPEGYKVNPYTVPVKWTGHVGANIDLKRKSNKDRSFGDISISPNVVFQLQFPNFMYFSEGFYLNFYPFTVGLWMRHSLRNVDAVIFTTGIQFENIRVGYSYDITASQLSGLTQGAHEVSIQILLKCPEKIRTIKDLKCPHY